MTNDFPRILLSLRKERRLTQKQAARDLSISPALLSHYEKGIRECGLQFVVRAADYYHVSCDYLLGRTTDRTGMAPELVSPQAVRTENHKPLELSAPEDLQQKRILQSVHILFRMLQTCRHVRLTAEVTHALSTLLYSLFRELCVQGKHTSRSLFSLPQPQYQPLAAAAISRAVARVGCLAQGYPVGEDAPLPAKAVPSLSEEQLSRDFPFFSASLLQVISEAETTLKEE